MLVLTCVVWFLHQQTSFYLARRTYSKGITSAGTRGRNESHLFNTHEVPCPKECLCFPPLPVSRALSQALIVLTYNAFKKSLLKLWLLLKLIRNEPWPGEQGQFHNCYSSWKQKDSLTTGSSKDQQQKEEITSVPREHRLHLGCQGIYDMSFTLISIWGGASHIDKQQGFTRAEVCNSTTYLGIGITATRIQRISESAVPGAEYCPEMRSCCPMWLIQKKMKL